MDIHHQIDAEKSNNMLSVDCDTFDGADVPTNEWRLRTEEGEEEELNWIVWRGEEEEIETLSNETNSASTNKKCSAKHIYRVGEHWTLRAVSLST